MTTALLNHKLGFVEIDSLGKKLKMENYILRESKVRNKEAFVLESTRVDCDPTTVRLSHQDIHEYYHILYKFRHLALGGLRKKIEKMRGLNRGSINFADKWFKRKICMSIELAQSDIPEERKSLRQMIEASKIPAISLSNDEKI